MPLRLTVSERDSSLWHTLTKYAEDRIQQLRLRNDGPHDAIVTADMRGRIQELKAFLALGQHDSPQSQTDTDPSRPNFF